MTRGMSFQPSVMEDDDAFAINDDYGKENNIDEDEEDSEDDEYEEPTKKSKMYGENNYSDEDDNDEDDEEDDDDALQVEGVYDPREFEHLNVDQNISSLFSLITKYKPQTIILDYKLKPFIPDYIPAVGDIDAFIKVNSGNDEVTPETLGLTVLDEPCAGRSCHKYFRINFQGFT